ncbi:MAG: DUF1501 domain-containing protein [Burkholderiales bacterium]
MTTTRREFLLRMGALGAVSSLDYFGALNALAQTAPGDYKALVCVFLYGGNDGNNTILPVDARYADYAKVRTSADIGLAIPAGAQLLTPPDGSVAQYGLHPALVDLAPLFSTGKMAALFNVGTLLKPFNSVAEYKASARTLKPANLFSHSDQQQQWQSGIVTEFSRSGWGGRIADRLNIVNGSGPIPMIISASGSSLFMSGESTSALTIPSNGGFGLSGFGDKPGSYYGPAFKARYDALMQLLAIDREAALVRGAGDITKGSIAASEAISVALTNPNTLSAPFFNTTTYPALNNTFARQLSQVAKVIEASGSLGLKPQIFFVQLGGFDTHNGQLAQQQRLFGQLGPGLKAFQDAMDKIGMANSVTTFTQSDFGRTLQPAAGGGSDHAWGNHHLIIGGAVKGGATYGTFPALGLGAASPDDVSTEGRWLPTTSADQYAATLASWFGVSATDMQYVLPNLGNFCRSNLGFMA